MNNKSKLMQFLPIIILVAVLVIILIFGIILLGNKEKKPIAGKEPVATEKDVIAPTLDLSLSTTEEEQSEVTIMAIAKTEDEEGIDHIILPDGSKITSDKKEYKVTENGKYTFKAVGVNGGEQTLSIEVKNIREISANNPYIPEGFEYVGGQVDTGYVIQDSFGNQYVWVPVSSGMLTRSTIRSTDYSESNSSASALVNSVAKNYGFYIGRFESSSYAIDSATVSAASMGNKVPWTNISFRNAETASNDVAAVFNYPEEVSTSLMNSYAWDTTLEWIDKSIPNYSSNTSYGNYSGTIYPTGSTQSDQINNICDLAGNVREWTTEEYSQITTSTNKKQTSKKNNNNTSENSTYRVIRGGSANLNKIASSRNGYPEELTDGYWGFRIIMFAN